MNWPRTCPRHKQFSSVFLSLHALLLQEGDWELTLGLLITGILERVPVQLPLESPNSLLLFIVWLLEPFAYTLGMQSAPQLPSWISWTHVKWPYTVAYSKSDSLWGQNYSWLLLSCAKNMLTFEWLQYIKFFMGMLLLHKINRDVLQETFNL